MSFYERHLLYITKMAYILCDTLQGNIIIIIFIEDGYHFFHQVAAGAKICDFFVKLWANKRQTDDVTS